MVNALDDLQQMAEEILDGGVHLAHLRHLEKPVTEGRALVRDTEMDVEFLKRMFTVKRLRIEAAINNVDLPFTGDDEETRAVRARVRREEVVAWPTG